ncbi:dTDP-4-dehydrorhamnose 3,5-epimerase family protein [Amycolatopsis sp. NPDC058278]|uniref:dTDP-4-dehydrorhamnose 3,5-epimerase family protein n=1 Tax=Amycolatopsis sp. NPDC058278 TaxID=3346417 RepID=UPI0036DD1D95
MQFRRLSVPDAYEFSPRAFPDDRGLFVAPFQEDAFLDAVGHPLRLGQSNHSVSRRGTIRGIHFADTPPGQAKYVYCPRGSLLDIVVDIRVGSPTFGRWDAVVLDSREFRAMYLAEGLGHGFVALEDDTAMTYFCSEPYNPAVEHGITPLDPALDLPWPADIERIMSDKDRTAPTLAEAREQGFLPMYADCVAYYDKLRSAH